jgi:hypothetical protein
LTYRQCDGEDEETLAVHVLSLFGPVEQFLCYPSDGGAVDDAQDDGVSPRFSKPQPDGSRSAAILSLAAMSGVLNQIQRQEQERVAQPIIRARLGNDNLLQLFRDIRIRKLALNNGIGQNRIRGRDTSTDSQSMQERDTGHEGEDEQAGDEPHGRHDGPDQQRKTLPFRLEVLGRQLYASEHELHAQYQPREVQRDGVERLDRVQRIFLWAHPVCCVRREDKTGYERDYCGAELGYDLCWEGELCIRASER